MTLITIKYEKMQDTIKVIVDTLFVSSKFNQENNHVDTNLILGMPMPLITFLGAFFIFIIGIGINWYNKKRTRQEGLIVIKNTILNWVGLINQSINDKVCRMSDFSSRVSKSDALQPESFDYNKIMADKLSTFSLKEYTDSFVLNLKGDESINAKHLFKIVSSLEFLIDVETDLMTKYWNYRMSIVELINSWNECVLQLKRMKLVMHLEFGTIESEKHSFYQRYITIIDNPKISVGDFSISKYQSAIIDPLFALVLEEVFSKSNPKYTVEIYDILATLNLILMKLKQINSSTSELFKEYSHNIEIVYKDLSDSCDHLKEKGLKPWYKIN